jgi:formate dehydrogenase assembly factor FdhD
MERIVDEGGKNIPYIIAEKPVPLFLNNWEVIALLAMPEKLQELAVGFMLSEGWLQKGRPVEKVEATRRRKQGCGPYLGTGMMKRGGGRNEKGGADLWKKVS